MNRRRNAGVIFLAMIGAGIGWLLATHRPGESADMHPVADSSAAPASLLTPTAPAIDDHSGPGDGSAGDPGRTPTDGPTGVTLQELETEYGDPTIARDARLAIQGVLDTALDRSRYEVYTVTCRDLNCQIFSNPKVPGAESDWPPIVEAMMQKLSSASLRNPETGAELKPELKSISRGRRAGAVTVTIIWLR